jgi:hypothetical protein
VRARLVLSSDATYVTGCVRVRSLVGEFASRFAFIPRCVCSFVHLAIEIGSTTQISHVRNKFGRNVPVPFFLNSKQTNLQNRNCHPGSTSAVGKGLGSAHIRSMPSWGAVASIALIALVATETHAKDEVKGGKTIEKAQACKETGADGQCGTGNFLREEKACLECYGWMTGLWAGWESEKGCGKVKKTRTRIVSLRDQIGSPRHHRLVVIAPRNRHERACWPAGHLRKFGRQPRHTSLG